MCVSYTLKINQLWILRFLFKMNHFEADLMVSSREVDSKVLKMAIQFEHFSDKKQTNKQKQNGECNVRNLRRFLFGMSADVPAFKVRVFTSDFKL